jgi:hypothetical protein
MENMATDFFKELYTSDGWTLSLCLVCLMN